MSMYLQESETEYVREGVVLTPSLILRASAIIDSHCKREIGVKEYKERIPLTDRQQGHLSYYPVKNVIAVKGRMKRDLAGSGLFGDLAYTEIDASLIDIDRETGSVCCCYSPFGIPYDELEVIYTSGWDPIPTQVKVVCGMLIESLVEQRNQNVKSQKDMDFTIEYFGNKLITSEMAVLLAPYQPLFFR